MTDVNATPERRLTVVVGITGGIAAYKAVGVVRDLVRRGHDAHVRDVGMVQKVTFQLRRRDLEPAHFDELLDAVDDEYLDRAAR